MFKKTISLALACIMILGIFSTTAMASSQKTATVSVSGTYYVGYNKEMTGGSPFALSNGSRVTVERSEYSSDGYLMHYCKSSSGQYGWISDRYLKFDPVSTPTPTYAAGRYTPSDRSGLYVRSGAGTNYTIVSAYSYGQSFDVTQVSGEWGRTDRGWVSLVWATRQGNLPANTPQPNTSSNGKYQWPLPSQYKTITTDFGRDYLGVVNGIDYGWRHHEGLDIAAPTGTSVYAAESGTVLSAGWYGDYGNRIKIDHGNGIRTFYAHLSRIDVSVGQWVSKGAVIGQVGSTGFSTGPHLHFEIMNSSDVGIDPWPYLR